MASGELLGIFYAWNGSPPTTNAAIPGRLVGTSTNNENVKVLLFDDTTDQFMDFEGVMPPNYDGGGVTATVIFAHSHASTGPTWGIAFRAIKDDAEDVDTTAHTYAFNTVAAGAPSAIGEFGYDDITFTDGADMDSVVADDAFLLRFERDALGDSTGNAKLYAIVLTET